MSDIPKEKQKLRQSLNKKIKEFLSDPKNRIVKITKTMADKIIKSRPNNDYRNYGDDE